MSDLTKKIMGSMGNTPMYNPPGVPGMISAYTQPAAKPAADKTMAGATGTLPVYVAPAMPAMPGMPNMPNMMQPSMSTMPGMTPAYPPAVVKPAAERAMTYRAIYPEIYYKLKPYIVMACDVMSSYGIKMPTPQQLEQMSDGIYDDFCKMYPDMSDYMHKADNMKSDPPGDPPGDPPRGGGFGGGFGGGRPGFDGGRPGFDGGRPGFDGGRPSFDGGFRRRGLGSDFIDALLLSELLGRGYYY